MRYQKTYSINGGVCTLREIFMDSNQSSKAYSTKILVKRSMGFGVQQTQVKQPPEPENSPGSLPGASESLRTVCAAPCCRTRLTQHGQWALPHVSGVRRTHGLDARSRLGRLH